jgi:TetR/AcrR family transcriptional regulator
MNARRKQTPEDNGRGKRMDILHAAFDVISEKGLYKTTVEDVARRAQVAKGTVYLYFKSKEDLFVEMVIDRLHHAKEEVLEAMSHEEGTWPKLRAAIRIHFQHMLTMMSQMMVGEGLMKLGVRHMRKLAAARQDQLSIYVDILNEHFAKTGETRYSARAAALALTGGLAGYIIQMHETRESVPAPEEYLKTFEAIVYAALIGDAPEPNEH